MNRTELPESQRIPATCTHVTCKKDHVLLSNDSSTVGLFVQGSPRNRDNKVFCRFSVAYLREFLDLAEQVYGTDSDLRAVVYVNKKKGTIMMINDVALAPIIDADCIAKR